MSPVLTQPPRRQPVGGANYFADSVRPLTVLVFLLPFILIYEIASAYYLADEHGRLVETIAAYALLARFFEVFGAFGLYLPGLALVVVLLLQHVLSRHRWRVRVMSLLMMLFESALLALPLLVLAVLLGPNQPVAAAVEPGTMLETWPWMAKLTIAVGAGLYEELLFRMVLIAIIHTLAVDLLGAKDGLGKVLAVVVSAVAFALYHDLTGAGGQIDPQRLAFYFGAGVYFGMLYLWRGFGIVVGAHMGYDTLVLLLLA